jgi:hypothetical protein
VRSNLLSLESARKRHIGSSPDPALYGPDLWVDEFYFLNQPGQGDIQLDLFYDYQNNVKSYPKWQQWLRDTKPPLLVIWRRYDTSFTVAGGEAYKKDNPRAEVHILDAWALCARSEAKGNHPSDERLSGKTGTRVGIRYLTEFDIRTSIVRLSMSKMTKQCRSYSET